MRLILIAPLFLALLAAQEVKTVQGYASSESEACEISVAKALKKADEDAIKSRCECYRQDGGDWLCYTDYIVPPKG